MTEYRITVVISAPDMQTAINRVIYPEGEPLVGLVSVTAVHDG